MMIGDKFEFINKWRGGCGNATIYNIAPLLKIPYVKIKVCKQMLRHVARYRISSILLF